MNCALISPGQAPERAQSSRQTVRNCPSYFGAPLRPIYQFLLVFLCCINCICAFNIKEPATLSLNDFKMSGLPSTSSLSIQLLPVHFSSAPLKTTMDVLNSEGHFPRKKLAPRNSSSQHFMKSSNMEVLKSRRHFIQKRFAQRNLKNLHSMKSPSTLCIFCTKSPYLFPSLANLSAPLTSSLKALNQGSVTLENFDRHFDSNRNQKSKKSPHVLPQIYISLPVKDGVVQKKLGNWMYKLFGGVAKLPLQSSHDVENTSIFAVSIGKVGSSALTFQSAVPTRIFRIMSSNYQPGAPNTAPNAALSKVSEILYSATATVNQLIILGPINKTKVYRVSAGLPSQAGLKGNMSKNINNVTSDIVIFLSGEDITGKIPYKSKSSTRITKASRVPYTNLYVLNMVPIKPEKESVKTSISTPHVEETGSIMDRPNIESSTICSTSKGSPGSSYTRVQSPGLQDATFLTTENGQFSSGSSPVQNPIETKSASSVLSSSTLLKATSIDSSTKTLSNSDTGSQGLLYITMLRLASMQTIKHQLRNIKLSTEVRGTEAYVTESATTTSPFPILDFLEAKNGMQVFTPKPDITTSDYFQLKVNSNPTDMTSIYSHTTVEITTSLSETTPHNLPVLTLQDYPVTPNSSLLNYTNFHTIVFQKENYSTVTAAPSSTSTTMGKPSMQDTLSTRHSDAPISTTPWLSQSYKALVQLSQNRERVAVSTSYAGLNQKTKAMFTHERQMPTSLMPMYLQSKYLKVTSSVSSALTLKSSATEMSSQTTTTSEESWTLQTVLVKNDRLLNNPGITFMPWRHEPILYTHSNLAIFPTPSFATALVLQCRLVGIKYTKDLLNPFTKAYRTLSKEVQRTMNKIFSVKYRRSFLGTEIKGFLNGTVIVQAEIRFQKSMSPPSNSDLVRTVITAAYKKTYNSYDWKIDPASVISNGTSMNNLDLEKLPISFLCLKIGFSSLLKNLIGPLETLRNEVVQILSPIVSLEDFVLLDVKYIHGDLLIKGDLYINSVTHTDARQILLVLKNLVSHSIDLSSLVVAGVRLNLKIYPVSFRVTNRELTVQLLDHSSDEFRNLAWDLEATVASVLKKSVRPLQIVVRDLLSGSVVCQGDLIYQKPVPHSKTVLRVLKNSVGPSNILGSSGYQVDPISFAVAGAKADAKYAKQGVPNYAIAIIAISSIALISMPILILLFLRTKGHKDKAGVQEDGDRDPEKGRTDPEQANKDQNPEKGRSDKKLGNRGSKPPVEQQ